MKKGLIIITALLAGLQASAANSPVMTVDIENKLDRPFRADLKFTGRGGCRNVLRFVAVDQVRRIVLPSVCCPSLVEIMPSRSQNTIAKSKIREGCEPIKITVSRRPNQRRAIIVIQKLSELEMAEAG